MTQIHEASHELVCSAHGAPSAAPYPAVRTVGVVAGHHFVGARSDVRI